MNKENPASGVKKRVKTTGTRLLEYAIMLFLVLIFFLGVVGILGILIPSGFDLHDLLQGKGFSFSAREPGLASWPSLSPGKKEPPGMQRFVAVLSETRNVVKSRGSRSIVWQPAEAGMRLVERDAVQTARDSGAMIRFAPKDTLEMGENSLIIIRELEKDPVRLSKRSSLLVIDGEFRGSLAGPEEKTFEIQLGKTGARARIRSGGDRSGPADFQVTVNPDRSTTLSMFQGTAEVVAKGVTVHLAPNSSTTVAESGTASPAEELPDSPVLSSPSDNAVFYYRSLPPKVSLAWNAPEGTDGYRIFVARDPEFRDVVVEKRVSDPSFDHGNLKEGTYYWRVSGTKRWAEGLASRSAQFLVVKDSVPPDLRVETVGGGHGEERCRLKGAAEPGASVYVSGNPVPVAETGEFECDVRLALGINVIVVEAVDPAGNVAYRSVRRNRTY